MYVSFKRNTKEISFSSLNINCIIEISSAVFNNMDVNFNIYNATEIWQRETSLPCVPTFSRSLDNILGNDGLQLSSITEITGLPGTGKTQLCLQLCASIQIPKILGGLDAEALYIDTNTHFTPWRFKEILMASLAQCQRLLDISLPIKEENALKKLHYVNAFGLEKFCSFLHLLPKFIEEHPHIKLIAIDSIAYPFKVNISARERTGLLFRLMAELQRLAVDKQIAIVLTNEMSTRLGLSSGSIVSALGDAWSHRCNKKVLLSVPEGAEVGNTAERVAVLVKSNNSPNAVGRFQITPEGIRDVD